MILGFKRRFESMVLDGSKTHTIRAKGKRHWRVGMSCDCYGDVRQKTMHLLGRWLCVAVQDIRIRRDGWVFIDSMLLDMDERDLLAWRDGFRPFGTSEARPMGSFDVFFRYWRTLKQNGKKRALPFSGDLIHWDFRKPKPQPHTSPRTKRRAIRRLK